MNLKNEDLMVQDKLEKLHKVQIEIMDEIHRICVKNHIIYYLVGGSALGAIRHGGFIPWDDDIDICMPRRDFEQFISIAPEQMDSRFFLQTDKTDPNFGLFIAKVRRNGTLFVEDKIKDVKINRGIFVDIFILDDSKGHIFLQRIFSKLIWKCSKVLNIQTGWYNCNPRLKFFYNSFNPLLLKKIRYKLLTWYSTKRETGYYVNYGSQYGVVKQTFKKKVFGIPQLVKFEMREYYIPQQPQVFLRQLYGEDYMELPPVEKRICHNPVQLDFGNAIK